MVRVAKYLRQACYYWEPEGLDTGGQPIFVYPVKIACRWDDVSEQYYTDTGEIAVSKSKILVDQDLKVGGLLILSQNNDLDDWSDLIFPDDPWHDENGQARPIRSFDRIPDRRGRISRGVRIARL
jgi:hypothetical protein